MAGMNRYFLLLGSNVGDRMDELNSALSLISRFIGIPDKISSVYETAAWGKTDQQPFLNQVVSGLTDLDPFEVMREALTAERLRGRIREAKWAPRTIDIDLLFFDDQRISEPELTVPHPMLHLRRFTLVPLCEIFPDFRHPVIGKPLCELLEELEDSLDVRRYIPEP
ncbi:MAG: hypothetical protein RL021_1573 [Bacteroidota bacterium]|jgi:2-amino-4-hydroxy-6-hydroxymethyldihydropteridine diphosphokinase